MFWLLQLNSEVLRIMINSQVPILGVWVSSSHSFQSRVATSLHLRFNFFFHMLVLFFVLCTYTHLLWLYSLLHNSIDFTYSCACTPLTHNFFTLCKFKVQTFGLLTWTRQMFLFIYYLFIYLIELFYLIMMFVLYTLLVFFVIYLFAWTCSCGFCILYFSFVTFIICMYFF